MRRVPLLVPVVVAAWLLAGCAQPDTAGPAGAASSEPPASASSRLTATDPGVPAAVSERSSATLPATSPAASDSSGTPVEATSVPLPGCTPDTLKTLAPGSLTLATGPTPARPWFQGDPAAGQGYEAAVAAAVADRLGYDPAHITWETVDPVQARNGVATGFDAFIDRQTIPDQPAAKVQFSTGYLDDSLVLLAPAGSPISDATSLADLAGRPVAVFPEVAALGIPAATKVATGPAAERAVSSGAVDGVIAPVTAAESLLGRSGLQVVGQVPEPAGQQARQLGMLIPAASTVAPCVSTALDTLRVEGTLTDLAHTWLPATAGPVLTTD